jgi:WD40 repeat protein
MVYPSSAKEEYALKQPGSIRALAFSPDGRWLAASGGEQVHLWNWGMSEKVATLTGHAGRVTTAQFSPDGKRLVTASLDGTAKLWDAATGKLVATFAPGTYKTGMGVAVFSPDGRSLVTAGDDGAIRVWDVGALHAVRLETVPGTAFQRYTAAIRTDIAFPVAADPWAPRELRRFEGLAGPVSALAVSPDGQWLLSADRDRTVRVWDPDSGRERLQLALPDTGGGAPGDREVRSVAVTPDGRYAAAGSAAGAVVLWDLPSGKVLALSAGHAGAVLSVAFTPDGRSVASGGRDGTVRLWEVPTGRALRSLGGMAGAVGSLTFSQDGSKLVAGGDRTVRVWDVPTGREMDHRRLTEPVADVAFSLDGQRLLAAAGDVLYWWEFQGAKPVHRFGAAQQGVLGVAFLPDGRRAVSVGRDGSLKVWNLDADAELARVAVGDGPVKAFALSPDGRFLAVANGGNVPLWDLMQPTTPAQGPVPSAPANKPTEKRFRFEFRNKPWGEVFEWLSDQTGRPVVAATKPTGSVTLKAEDVTLLGVIDLLNELLVPQKFLLIRRDASFTVVPADERIDPALVPRVRVDELAGRGRSELVSVVLPLGSLAGKNLSQDVRKMLGPFGEVTVLPNHRLLLQDTAGNLRRIVEAIGFEEGKGPPPAAPPSPGPAGR